MRYLLVIFALYFITAPSRADEFLDLVVRVEMLAQEKAVAKHTCDCGGDSALCTCGDTCDCPGCAAAAKIMWCLCTDGLYHKFQGDTWLKEAWGGGNHWRVVDGEWVLLNPCPVSAAPVFALSCGRGG